MTRYYVPEQGGAALTGPAALQAIARVRVALDQANGLRDAAGNPTTKTMYLVRGPCTVDRDVDGRVTRVRGNVLATHERGGTVTSDSNVVVGDDGTVALELPDELDEIDEHLGTTVRGVAIPSRGGGAGEGTRPALDPRPLALAAVEHACLALLRGLPRAHVLDDRVLRRHGQLFERHARRHRDLLAVDRPRLALICRDRGRR